MKNNIRKTAVFGILTTVAMVLSYVEAILPPIWPAVPGVKVGLPNIVIIFLLYKVGIKEAAIVSGIRIILVALLFGNVMTLAYSTAGAVLSLVLMGLFKKINWFSTLGVSIIGAITHNLGQIAVAILLLGTKEIGYYMIILAITGTLAGAFVGITASVLLKKFEKINLL